MAEPTKTPTAFPWAREQLDKASGWLDWMFSAPGTPYAAPRAKTLADYDHAIQRGVGHTLLNIPIGTARTALNWLDMVDAPAGAVGLPDVVVERGTEDYRPGPGMMLAPGDQLAPLGVGAAGVAAQLTRSGGTALGIFGGRVAASNLAKAGRPAAQEALEMADALSKRGLSDEAIRATVNEHIAKHDPKLGGVDRDASGAWRFEIDDSGARLLPDWDRPTALGTALDHPEFYAAYPGARTGVDYQVVPGQGGMYSPGVKVMGVELKRPDIAIGADSKGPLGVVVHEGQHYAQEIEKRAPGSTAQHMREQLPNLPEATRESLRQSRTVQSLRHPDMDPATAERLERQGMGIEAYRRVTGEVEGRVAQTRQDLTAAERRATDPRLHEDVPRQQQIELDRKDRLIKQAQLAPTGPISLKEKGRLDLGDGKTKATFHIVQNDGNVGHISVTYNDRTKNVYVWWVEANGDGGTANSLGAGATRQVLRELKRQFPDMQGIAGQRISGARTNLADDAQDVSVKVRSTTGSPIVIEMRPVPLPAGNPEFGLGIDPGLSTYLAGDDHDRGYARDLHVGANASRRVKVVAVDDTGPIQMVTVQGLADEEYQLPLRGQGFGMTSVPPIGSVGYLSLGNGSPDQAFLYGLEHPDQRPTDRAEGEASMYATPGQRIDLQGADVKAVTPGRWHTNPGGGGGKKYARRGDTSTHGGQITTSAAKSYCEGKLIAREGDTLDCPEHGPNPIVGHSSKTKVEGQWLARHGDATACGATLISDAAKTDDE